MTSDDTLSAFCRKVDAKIGFTPFMPEYAKNHTHGATVGIGGNFASLVIAQAGYLACETMFQHARERHPAANELLEKFNDTVVETVRYQGSDFFAGAFYAQMAGGAITEAVRIGAQMKAPQSGFTKFWENNYRIIRSTIGFAMLAGYELKQAQWRMAFIDQKDLLAYGLGIATICHGPEIIGAIGRGIKNIFSLKKTQPQ